jgi:hypothetical protein
MGSCCEHDNGITFDFFKTVTTGHFLAEFVARQRKVSDIMSVHSFWQFSIFSVDDNCSINPPLYKTQSFITIFVKACYILS